VPTGRSATTTPAKSSTGASRPVRGGAQREDTNILQVKGERGEGRGGGARGKGDKTEAACGADSLQQSASPPMDSSLKTLT